MKLVNKALVITSALCLFSWLGFLLADLMFPLPQMDALRAVAVLDKDGELLRSFADDQGVWRQSIDMDDVSPKYFAALINYEDRWYYDHPGINPLALVRAAYQRLRYGRFISGGSTLTMQVARLMDPHSKSLPGKLKQMFRALQLEYHFSKHDILQRYVDNAPFGGPLEGVAAASQRYLGKSPKYLTWSEAALLAVLPQAPSHYRPDRYPESAHRAKNKVLKRLAQYHVISPEQLSNALQEHLPQWLFDRPMSAPLLARQLYNESKQSVIRTTIDGDLQRHLESLVKEYASRLPEGVSAAVMVVEHDTMAVRAYIGSADLTDASRYGYVDMVRAKRSPGSTLKPFLYGIAMDDGLIHSHSLLADAPYRFDGYAPGNFDGMFHGPVTVEYALQKSLNVPAVQVLQHLGSGRFHASMEGANVPLQLPANAKPNLATILGGTATSLADLVVGYSALAHQGVTHTLRFRPEDTVKKHRLLSESSAWVIRELLQTQPRPSLNADFLAYRTRRALAWKTGTSYGFRDAWAMGVTPQYVVGVWVGRPDGTPAIGQYGANTAAPLLFQVADQLPQSRVRGFGAAPSVVQKQAICWPLGLRADQTDKSQCYKVHQAWLIQGVAPGTLATPADNEPLLAVRYVAGDGRYATSLACDRSATKVRIARWPAGLDAWTGDDGGGVLPWQPGCARQTVESGALSIRGFDQQAALRAPAGQQHITTDFAVLGADQDVWWMLDGRLVGHSTPGEPWRHQFEHSGVYRLLAQDARGRYTRLKLDVIID